MLRARFQTVLNEDVPFRSISNVLEGSSRICRVPALSIFDPRVHLPREIGRGTKDESRVKRKRSVCSLKREHRGRLPAHNNESFSPEREAGFQIRPELDAMESVPIIILLSFIYTGMPTYRCTIRGI